MIPRRVPLAASALAAAVLGSVVLSVPAPDAVADAVIDRATVVSGLTQPWDVTWVDDLMLFDLRLGELWSKRGSAAPRQVSIDLPPLLTEHEGGLLGLVAAPDAGDTGVFFTCASTADTRGNPVDVRVLRWRLTSDTAAVSDGAPVLTGIPVGTGRHNGCRLRFGADGLLYVGTGDAAGGTNPQDPDSLGGKVLRVTPTGGVPADNPYADQAGSRRYVWNLGHRNVQGLALRPGTGQLWSVEHGPTRDDEVNLLAGGANYGWDPVPGYNEAVSMTDRTKYPQARPAVWTSGSPPLAPSGGAFLTGDAWGRWQGALALGLLRGQGVLVVSLNPAGGLARAERLPLPTGSSSYGRIRAVQQGPDGALYLTTSNSNRGNASPADDAIDRIVRLTPRAPRAAPGYRPGQDVSPVGVSAVRVGSELSVFVRSTADRVYLKRSTDDGATWTDWLSAGVTSTSAPSVASSAPGRIDLVTRNSAGNVVHTWYAGGRRAGQRSLGGYVTSAPTVVSAAPGTLDVVARGGGTYSGFRTHFDGRAWTGWTGIGGTFTSALGAGADLDTSEITVTGRGTNGGSYEQTLTPGGQLSGWRRVAPLIWSARALADSRAGRPPVGLTSGSDGNATVDVGELTQGVTARYDSAPDVVSRADGTWLMFGRSTDGALWMYDARQGQYRNRSLGGAVR